MFRFIKQWWNKKIKETYERDFWQKPVSLFPQNDFYLYPFKKNCEWNNSCGDYHLACHLQVVEPITQSVCHTKLNTNTVQGCTPLHNLFCHPKLNTNTVQEWTTTKCPHMIWRKTKLSMTSYSMDMSSTLWTKRWDMTYFYVWHDEFYVWRAWCMRVTRARQNSFVWNTDMSSRCTSWFAHMMAAVWLDHMWHASFIRCALKRTSSQKTYMFLEKFKVFGERRTRPNIWRPLQKVPTLYICVHIYISIGIYVRINTYISICIYPCV